MIFTDFSLGRYEDGVLTVTLTPPTPIGGWTIRFMAQRHFGGLSGYAVKYTASGLDGMSGITITNSGLGIFNIQLNSSDMSGLPFGNYATGSERLDSGQRTDLTQGFWSLNPSTAP